MYMYTQLQCSICTDYKNVNREKEREKAQSEIFSSIMAKFKEDTIHLLLKKRNMGKKAGDT